jgi:intracellular multiplication protein IcmJ
MDLLPITLGVTRPPVRKAAEKDRKIANLTDKKIPNDLKARIFERDGYNCRYCGFHSRKYQEINFLNGDKVDLNEKNLVTACIFCQQCFCVNEVSVMRSGVLLWLPEIGQHELHHMARAIYVARISQGPVADAARKALDVLMSRREEVKKRISTDNPYILATVLRDYLGPKHYAERSHKLKGVRLFPLDRRIIREADLEFNQFPQILAYWRSKDGPFGGKPPNQWIGLYQDLVRQAA